MEEKRSWSSAYMVVRRERSAFEVVCGLSALSVWCSGCLVSSLLRPAWKCGREGAGLLEGWKIGMEGKRKEENLQSKNRAGKRKVCVMVYIPRYKSEKWVLWLLE